MFFYKNYFNSKINILEDKNNKTLLNKGYVQSYSNGVAVLSNLFNSFLGEVLIINNEKKVPCIVTDLKKNGTLNVIVLNAFGKSGVSSSIETGNEVYRTYKPFLVKTGPYSLGTLQNSIGNIILKASSFSLTNKFYNRPYLTKAPGIKARDLVTHSLGTGLSIVDSLTPIGRGQRQLIIGDKFTGKTSIAIDTILNQRIENSWGNNNDFKKSFDFPSYRLFCIYVGIGQRFATIRRMFNFLDKQKAAQYTTLINSSPYEPASVRFIAPYIGCALGEYYRDNGQHALVIFDDLSNHADSYRQMSLILGSPTTREAYPADIFYVHSALLERAGQLSKKLGGGSLTAFPIVETLEEDLVRLVPTNIISITDGQIYLSSDLFKKGQKPALNELLSISRVGALAQNLYLKHVSKDVLSILNQFRYLEPLADKDDSELDIDTTYDLKRALALSYVLNQPKNSPRNVIIQSCMLYVVTKGLFDEVERSYLIESIQKFQKSLITFYAFDIYALHIFKNSKASWLPSYLFKFLDRLFI